MVLWLFYFSSWWNKGLKLKIPLFKSKQLLPGADRNLVPSGQPRAAFCPWYSHPLPYGVGEQCVWACYSSGFVLVSFSFILRCEEMDSVKKIITTCCVEISLVKAGLDLQLQHLGILLLVLHVLGEVLTHCVCPFHLLQEFLARQEHVLHLKAKIYLRSWQPFRRW